MAGMVIAAQRIKRITEGAAEAAAALDALRRVAQNVVQQYIVEAMLDLEHEGRVATSPRNSLQFRRIEGGGSTVLKHILVQRHR